MSTIEDLLKVTKSSDSAVPLKEQFGTSIPELKENVTYIVCGLLFNDKDEVLMIQEAKASCRGLWYLPAGRLEKGETFEAGVTREVEEESGLSFKPESIICVESNGGSWFRILFTGLCTGGTLKTTAEADQESLQAGWFPVDSVLNQNIRLRSRDFLPLLKVAHGQHTGKGQVHPQLTIKYSLQKMVLRLCLVVEKANSVGPRVLVSKKDNNLPVFEPPLIPNSLGILLEEMLQTVLAQLPDRGSTTLLGALDVTHAPPHDGLGMTLLVDLKSDAPVAKDYCWLDISASERLEKQKLITIMGS